MFSMPNYSSASLAPLPNHPVARIIMPSPHDIVLGYQDGSTPPCPPPPPLTVRQQVIIEDYEEVNLQHVRDLGECPLGDAMLHLAAFFEDDGTAWAGVRHFGIESNLLLEAEVILPAAFNEHVVGVMTKRHPFIIIDTRTRFEGRWCHEKFVPIIQRLVRHSSVAVAFSSTFGQEPTKFICYVVDFARNISIDRSATRLSSAPRRHGAPNLTSLRHQFPAAKQPTGSDGSKALAIIRNLPGLIAEGRPLHAVSPIPVPPSTSTLPDLSPSLVERATVNALRRLLHDPLSTQQESVVVKWNAEPALAVVKVRGDTWTDWHTTPGDGTAAEWGEDDDTPTPFPVAGTPEEAMDHSLINPLLPTLVTRNLPPRCRLLIWGCALLDAITHGVFVHQGGRVRLVSLARFCSHKPSASTLRRVLSELSEELSRRFEIAVHPEGPGSPEDLPARPIHLFKF